MSKKEFEKQVAQKFSYVNAALDELFAAVNQLQRMHGLGEKPAVTTEAYEKVGVNMGGVALACCWLSPWDGTV